MNDKYRYEDWKAGIFTEQGQVLFLATRDKVRQLLKQAGAFKHSYGYPDNWTSNFEAAACIDRLVELGEIREVTRDTAWPDRIFTGKYND